LYNISVLYSGFGDIHFKSFLGHLNN